MPSKQIFVATAEVTRTIKGISDLLIIRNQSASRSDRFLGLNDSVPIGSTLTIPNPVSLFVISPGLPTGDSTYTGRNSMEARPDAEFLLCGSGSVGTEFRVAAKFDTISRTNQGDMHIHKGVGVSEKFTLPTL
jgi:hypothetical protein